MSRARPKHSHAEQRRHEEHQETEQLLRTAFALARSLDISAIVVQADQLRDVRLIGSLREHERLIWFGRDGKRPAVADPGRDVVLRIPEASLSRLSQLNLALFLAALERHVTLDQRVLGLCGVTGSSRLDTLLISKPGRDFPWLEHHRRERAITRHLARILEVSLRLSREGREGTPLGGIFVLGDLTTLDPYLRQLVLNPLKGHPQTNRSIHDPELFETLRELAAIDGAFVVSRRGIVRSAGTYLDAPVGRRRLSPGLGARHAAAQAITTVTDATAVVISASSGTVIVYDNGEPILELDRVEPGR